ncbi:hypothetical protein V2A60_002247 [Cordyceps javanica]
MSLSMLSNELVLAIADSLGERDIANLRQTCRRYDEILKHELYKRNVKYSEASSLLWACEQDIDMKCTSHVVVSNAIAAGADVNMVGPASWLWQWNRYNLRKSDEIDVTPLKFALRSGNEDIAMRLVAAGADIKFTLQPDDQRILRNAVRKCESFTAQYLLTEKMVEIYLGSTVYFEYVLFAFDEASEKLQIRLVEAVNDADETGRSLLKIIYYYTAKGSLSFLELILQRRVVEDLARSVVQDLAGRLGSSAPKGPVTGGIQCDFAAVSHERPVGPAKESDFDG